MRGRVRNCLHGLALLSGLLIADQASVARAQYNRTVPASAPNGLSVHRGMYSAGPIGGIQQYNPAWQSNGEVRRDNGNFAYPPGYAAMGTYTPEMASKLSFGSLAASRYGYGYGYGSDGGWWNANGSKGGVWNGNGSNGGNWNSGGWNGSGWNNNGANMGYWTGGPWKGNSWAITNWGVPYGVSGVSGNSSIQLPSYGISGVNNGTDYGVSNYGSFSNQYGAFGIPSSRASGVAGSSTEASAFGW